MSEKEKIFGIGLSRTGTSSLRVALGKLGYKHKSVPISVYYKKGAESRMFDNYSCFTDAPIMMMYKKLDQKYPNSKFILTTRDVEGWLISMRWLFRRGRYIYRWDQTPRVHDFLTDLYSTKEFDKKSLKKSWFRHHSEVREYFGKKREKLLVVDWTSGDGWEELCNFLGKKKPDNKFPHINKSGLIRELKYYYGLILKNIS